jgi:hypothetical protein
MALKRENVMVACNSRSLLPHDFVLRNKHTYLINTTTGMSHLTIKMSGSCCHLWTLLSALVFDAPRFAINHSYLHVQQLWPLVLASVALRMSKERRWNVTDVENRRNRKGKNLSRCHVVYRRYHMDWPDIESGPLRFVQYCAAFGVISSWIMCCETSLLFVRFIRNTQTHCVDKIQGL